MGISTTTDCWVGRFARNWVTMPPVNGWQNPSSVAQGVDEFNLESAMYNVSKPTKCRQPWAESRDSKQ